MEGQVLEILKDTFLGPSFVWTFTQQRAAEGYFDKIVIIMPNKPFVGSVEHTAVSLDVCILAMIYLLPFTDQPRSFLTVLCRPKLVAERLSSCL